MTTVDIKALKPAKRYEDALFSLIEPKNRQNALLDIDLILNTIENSPELKAFLYHPLVTNKDKKETLFEIFSDVDKTVLDFLCILIDAKRLDCLDEIKESLKEDVDTQNNTVHAGVTLAIIPDTNLMQHIKNKLEEKLKMNVIIDFALNKDIIGGMIIKIKDTIIDLSIQKKLENFKKA